MTKPWRNAGKIRAVGISVLDFGIYYVYKCLLRGYTVQLCSISVYLDWNIWISNHFRHLTCLRLTIEMWESLTTCSQQIIPLTGK